MTRITLKPAHFHDKIIVTPSWISNGMWAVRRPYVVNSAMFGSLDTVRAFAPKVNERDIWVKDDDSMIDRILSSIPESARAFTVTKWTYDGDNWYALAVSDAHPAFLDRVYLALLQAPDMLYAADANGTFTDARAVDDRSFVLMPARITKDGAHLKPIVDLVHAIDAVTPVPELVEA